MSHPSSNLVHLSHQCEANPALTSFAQRVCDVVNDIRVQRGESGWLLCGSFHERRPNIHFSMLQDISSIVETPENKPPSSGNSHVGCNQIHVLIPEVALSICQEALATLSIARQKLNSHLDCRVPLQCRPLMNKPGVSWGSCYSGP